jgi:hypothetical protein
MPGITGDPHLKGGDGDLTDFKGEDNTVYNVLSARNFSVNVLFWHDVFPMSHKLVEGSFMKQAFITVRSNRGKLVYATYGADDPTTAAITKAKDSGTQVLHPTPKDAIDGSVKIDNIDVSFVAGNVRTNNNELRVSNGEWRVAVKSMPYPPYNPWVFRKADARLAQYVKDGAGKTRVDVRIGPIGGLRLKPVAPHGLLGQTYDGDGIAVDGAMDDYHGEYVVTTAMGEGAIEGAPSDYAIERATPFSTLFTYSRFDAKSALPRDVSKLTGLKRRVPTSEIPEMAGAVNDRVSLPEGIGADPAH